MASIRHGRGAAYGDFDNDGKLDFVVNNAHLDQDSTQFELFHNVSADNNWIVFQLQGLQSNRDAFGSHVRIYQNGVSTISEVGGGSSHGSQNSSIVHFGLGSETSVDSVIVSFPSGINRVLTNVSGNQVVEVFEDISTGTSPYSNQELVELFYNNGMPVLRSTSSLNVNIQLLDVSGKMLIQKSVIVNRGEIPLLNFLDLSVGVNILKV